METIRIIIASSAELKPDRDAFREFLKVENNRLHSKGLCLELVHWDHFLDSVSQTSLQDEYNKELKKCAIIVCLFHTKAGEYTQLEFDTALKLFHDKGSPLIYTFFKTGAPAPDPANEQAQYLVKFKKRLGKIGHFYTSYNSTEDLLLQFRKQLDKIEDKGLIKLKKEIKAETKVAVANYIKTLTNTNTANVRRNNKKTYNGVADNQDSRNTDNQKTEKIVNMGTIPGGIDFGISNEDMSSIDSGDNYEASVLQILPAMDNADTSNIGSVDNSKTSDPHLPIEFKKQKQENREEVSVNIYAPPKFIPGKSQFIQVWLFIPEDEKEVKEKAHSVDDEASKLGFENLFVPIEYGTEIMLSLSSQDIQYSEQKSFPWLGKISNKNFNVEIPGGFKKDKVIFTLEVYINGLIAGEITFMMKASIKLISNDNPSTDDDDKVPKPVGDKAKRFKKAFISYASKDRIEVLERVQGIAATKVFEIFQDIMDLEPGERWEKRLYKEIDSCDVFFLFWSKAASESPWVIKELEYAIQLQKGDHEYPLKIQPVIIPPIIKAPQQLGYLHFNDKIVQFIIAEKQIRKSRGKV